MPVLQSQNPYHQHYTLQNETNAMLRTFNLLNHSLCQRQRTWWKEYEQPGTEADEKLT